jgi:hypothetical protein
MGKESSRKRLPLYNFYNDVLFEAGFHPKSGNLLCLKKPGHCTFFEN